MSQPPQLDRTLRRLVVALGAHSRDEATLTLAADLARRLDAELSGLFVEDSDLFDIAALPVTSLLAHQGTRRRTLDVSSIERCFRVEEQRLRRLMAAVSERHRLNRWSFGVRRGRGGDELARDLGADDLLVIATRSREERRRRLSETLARDTVYDTLVLPPGRLYLRRHILVLHEGGTAALSAGGRLAAALDARLSALCVRSGQDDTSAEERALHDLAGVMSRPVAIAGTVWGDAESLRAAIDGLAPDVVAVARPGPVIATMDTEILDAVLGPRALLITGEGASAD